MTENIDQAGQTPQLEDQASRIAAEEALYAQETRQRTAIGTGLMVAGGAAVAAETLHLASNVRLSYSLPFVRPLQEGLIAIDDVLAHAGEVVLPSALIAIGGLKLAAHFSNRARNIDRQSSKEMADDGHDKKRSYRRAMERVFAGGVPAVLAFSAAFGTFSAADGAEITNGPERVLQSAAFDRVAPGNTWIVEGQNTMPMEQSNLTLGLALRVQEAAKKRGVTGGAFNLSLGDVQIGNQVRTSLAIGTFPDEASPISWKLADTCKDIPIAVDSSAGVRVGEHVDIQGVNATVVEEESGLSAINRIGVVMSQAALAECIQKDTNLYAITLNTTPEEGHEILTEANTADEAATVITKQEFIDSSTAFWSVNSKPNTNILVSAGLLVAAIAMSSSMGARMIRNRREHATKFAHRVTQNTFRATELMRATKDGVAASIVGVTAATLVTPLANMVESGFRISAGYKEWMVGAAVGILGSVGGAAAKVIRPKKLIDVSKDTR